MTTSRRRTGVVLIVAAFLLAHHAALAVPRGGAPPGLRGSARQGSKSSGTSTKSVRPRGPLAFGQWEGGSCILESRGRLVYTYGSGPNREVRVHDFGEQEAIKKVLALRCGRRSSGLLTTTHYLGFPGAEEVYRTGIARPAGHEPPPARARSGQSERHKPVTADERDALLRALRRKDGTAKIVSIGFVMSKIAVVEEWGKIVGWTLTPNGPVVLHSDGTLAALVSTTDGHAWRGWQLVKRGLPGTQIRSHRGLTIVAVPGSDVLKVARVPRNSGESCQVVERPLGSRLSAAPVLRRQGDALYLVSGAVSRRIRVERWGGHWGLTLETEQAEAAEELRDGKAK